MNYVLILLGFLISAGILVYAAQPWGDNYAYQEFSGYVSLLLWELWVGLPFLALYLLNRKYSSSSPHLKLLFFACLIGSISASCIYADSILFSRSSTSALIYAALPVYQLLFLAIVGVVCVIMTKRVRGSDKSGAPRSGAP